MISISTAMQEPTEQQLLEWYHDPSQPGSFGGIDSLVRLAREKGYHLTQEKAKRFLQGQNTYTLHGRVHKEKGLLNERIVTSGPFDLWEADLMDMLKGSRVKYLLNIIDAHSKKAWVQPLHSKRPAEVKDAFTKVLQEGLPKDVKLNGLRTDAGKEFFNRVMKEQVCIPNGLNHYRAQKPPGAAIVERFNRTLGEKLERYKTSFPNKKDLWPIVQPIVKAYNNSWHSMLRSTPEQCHQTAYQQAAKGADALLAEGGDMSLPEKRNEIVSTYLHTQLGRNKEPHQWDPVSGAKADDALAPGTYVRLHKRKNMFEKGRVKNFSDEYFQIEKQAGQNPNAYHIKDEKGEPIIGKIYRRQLQRLSRKPDIFQVHILKRRHLKRKPAEVLVQWVGHPHIPPEWIAAKDLVQE